MRCLLALTLLTLSSLVQAANVSVDVALERKFDCALPGCAGQVLLANNAINTGHSIDEVRRSSQPHWTVMFFDLPELSDPIASASMNIYLGSAGYGVTASEASVYFSLVEQEWVDDMETRDAFLGEPTYFGLGSTTLTADDQGSWLTIELPYNLSLLQSLGGQRIGIELIMGEISGWDIECEEVDPGYSYPLRCPSQYLFDNDSLGTATLSMNVVPIPPAILLFASALAGLGWLRKRG